MGFSSFVMALGPALLMLSTAVFAVVSHSNFTLIAPALMPLCYRDYFDAFT